MANVRREYTHGITWIVTKNIKENTGSKQYSRYKLHIRMDVNAFDQWAKIIDVPLSDATNKGIIPKYKIFNMPIKLPEYNKLKDKYKHHINLKANGRYIYALPVTIYLYNDLHRNNFDALSALCKQIETMLKDVPSGDENYLCVSDISLTSHVMFRQAVYNDEYVCSFDQQAGLLKEAGENSAHYKRLKALLLPTEAKVATAVQAKESEFSSIEEADENKSSEANKIQKNTLSHAQNQRFFPDPTRTLAPAVMPQPEHTGCFAGLKTCFSHSR